MTYVLVAPGTAIVGATLALDDDEQHHLKVRRVAAGADVTFTDGAGVQGAGGLVARGRDLALEIRTCELIPQAVSLILAAGAGDRERFGWLVEKATELGVTEIIPLETERTRGVATGLRPEQVARLRRRAREALKQCGGAWVPLLHDPRPFNAFISGDLPEARWMLDATGGAPPPLDAVNPVVALIGPEGGLGNTERSLALRHGFAPVSAGPHTLRFETAAISAAILVQAARMRATLPSPA